MKIKRGFTLVELMVSMTLGLIILGIIGYAFNNASIASSRGMRSLDKNQRARILMARLERDITASHPCFPINITVSGVECVTSAARLDANYDGDVVDAGENTDLRWVKYALNNAGTGTTAEDDWLDIFPPSTYPNPPTAAAYGTGVKFIEGVKAFKIEAYKDGAKLGSLPATIAAVGTNGASPRSTVDSLKITFNLVDEYGDNGTTFEHMIPIPGAN
jgi:prepilin-type N-terminal cleavage/methylation domain-containing protein